MNPYAVYLDERLQSEPSPTRPLVQSFEVEGLEKQKRLHRKRSKTPTSGDFAGELDQEIRSFKGYYAPLWKQILFWAIGILTGGVSLLVTKWKKEVYTFLSLSSCALKVADYVLVELVDGRKDLVKVSVLSLPRLFGDSHPALNGDTEHGVNLLDDQSSIAASRLRLLEYRCGRYFYVDSVNSFVPVPDIPKDFNEQLQKTAMSVASASHLSQVDESDVPPEARQLRYGPNEMRIHVPSILNIVWEEMWHPFYVFQYFSIAIWVFGDQYYSYSVCIALITWFSILTSAVETHNNMKRLANLAYYACEVEVLRDGQLSRVSSTALVPGDLVVVEPAVLSCDVVLLKGEAIVDENMLTGESVPVRKVSYSPVADGLNYQPDKNANCTLYAGTLVAQARAPRNQKVIGMVCRTSFFSAKGALLRSILFPKEVQETFIGDALWFIAMMGIGCIGLYLWAATSLIDAGAGPGRIIIRLFDMITVAVPPALPACLTICTVFAIGRLRKKGIFVTNPERITMAGHLDVIAFDKTGTLTQQGLELKGVVPIMNGTAGELTAAMSDLPLNIVELSASCHGLARMGTQLVGDPLDQKLFAATHWLLLDDGHADEEEEQEEDHPHSPAVHQHKPHQIHTFVHPPGNPTSKYAVLRRFEFSSQAQRNGVVVRAPDGRTMFFSKGSPEMIRTLVDSSSIPANFDQVLESYTREGYRVLAMAQANAGHVDAEALLTMTQDEVESGLALQLVGFAVMDNPLRHDTNDVIHKLQMADLRCCMVTGDHVRTAISVSHQCGIMRLQRPICLVDALSSHLPGENPLFLSVLQPMGAVQDNVARSVILQQVSGGDVECAVTGKGFSKLLEGQDNELFIAVLKNACVFARMSPDNKKDLMLLLGHGMDGHDAPSLGLSVGFCGDGANDCGALKAAHVGVSLCEAEASVAAPMTSKEQTIAAMIKVVSEGRCTLMATFQIFQFIIGYAMVQAFSTNLMYTVILDLGNYQYLIQDLFFTTVLAALMGYTEPRSTLSRDKPLQRVMSWPLMTSTAMQLVIVIVFQIAALDLLKQQPGYSSDYSHRGKDLKDVRAPENTTVYLMGISQFIILALVFNKGMPHRSAMYTNWQLSLALLVQIGFILFSFFSVNKFNSKVQELETFAPPTTLSFRGQLLGLVVANAVAAVVAEYVLAPIVLKGINLLRSALTKKDKAI